MAASDAGRVAFCDNRNVEATDHDPRLPLRRRTPVVATKSTTWIATPMIPTPGVYKVRVDKTDDGDVVIEIAREVETS